jgi:hypothetical protein
MTGPALLAAGVVLSVLPGIAAAQALNSGGAKFIKNGESALNSVPARRRKNNECHTVMLGALKLCPANTDWIRESPYRPHEMEVGKTPPPALYQIDADRTGAVTPLAMPQGTSAALDLPAVAALINKHVFDPGPRGDRHRGNALTQSMSPDGRLTGLAHVTTDHKAAFVLLQVSLLYVPEGLAIVETSERIADFDPDFQITPAHLALHTGFVDAISFPSQQSIGQ